MIVLRSSRQETTAAGRDGEELRRPIVSPLFVRNLFARCGELADFSDSAGTGDIQVNAAKDDSTGQLGSSITHLLTYLHYSIRQGGPTRTSADVSVPRLAGFSLIT